MEVEGKHSYNEQLDRVIMPCFFFIFSSATKAFLAIMAQSKEKSLLHSLAALNMLPCTSTGYLRSLEDHIP